MNFELMFNDYKYEYERALQYQYQINRMLECIGKYDDVSLTQMTTYEEEIEEIKEEEPFIVVYQSKPIRGTVLELYGKNPNYNWEE